jgi:hypothetical protein
MPTTSTDPFARIWDPAKEALDAHKAWLRAQRLRSRRPADALAFGGVCSRCIGTRLGYLYEWRNLIYANRYVGLTGIEVWDGWGGRSPALSLDRADAMTAAAWDRYCDRSHAAAHPAPARAPTAMEEAGMVLAAAGEAERLAWEAMLDGRVRYSGRLGWAQRNLLECWLFYTRCTRIGGVSLDDARNHLRRAIRQYRQLNIAETRGIDTSAHGWRGGKTAAATPLERYLAAHPQSRGPRSDRTLTPNQVARIRAPGANLTALAKQFMISLVAVWKVKHRITYRDLP